MFTRILDALQIFQLTYICQEDSLDTNLFHVFVFCVLVLEVFSTLAAIPAFTEAMGTFQMSPHFRRVTKQSLTEPTLILSVAFICRVFVYKVFTFALQNFLLVTLPRSLNSLLMLMMSSLSVIKIHFRYICTLHMLQLGKKMLKN